jgi:hypothetical protein
MNADVATAAGRLVYSAEDETFYFGSPGLWTAAGSGSGAGVGIYADYASLPAAPPAGTVAVALDNGAGSPALYIYDTDDSQWHRIADELIVLSDGSIHFTAIPAVSNAGILPTQPPHIATKAYVDAALVTSTAAHNVDPYAHPLGVAGPANGGHAVGGADGLFSKSGQNVIETAIVIEGAHGSPLTRDPFFGVYKFCPSTKKPVGLLWKASTKTTVLGSASVVLDNPSSKITVTDNTGFAIGDVVEIPGASIFLNAGKYYTITGFELSTRLVVTPAPLSETTTSTVVSYKPNGKVVFNGRFAIDVASTVVTALPIVSITSSTHRIKLAQFDESYALRAGDAVQVSGTVANNGFYQLASYDRVTQELVLVSGLVSNAGAVGTVTISHPGQLHNFKTPFVDGDVATPFYLDDSNATYRYTQDKNNFLLGQQVNLSEFIVGIEQVNEYRLPIQTTTPTLVHELYQQIPVDTTGGAFDVNLLAGVEGEILDFIDAGNFCSTNTFTVYANGAETISGATNWVLDFDGMRLRMQFHGTNWEIF